MSMTSVTRSIHMSHLLSFSLTDTMLPATAAIPHPYTAPVLYTAYNIRTRASINAGFTP